jgi:hypothetical protein
VGQTGVTVDDLRVFLLEASFKHPLPMDLKGKAYAEFGYNFGGNERGQLLRQGSVVGTTFGAGGPAIAGFGGVNAANAFSSSTKDQNKFFVLGYTIGENKKKGDWSVDASYAYFETFSWDPNIADSDWNNSLLNGQGPGVKVVYNFTDFLTASVNYRMSWAIDGNAMPYQGLTTSQAQLSSVATFPNNYNATIANRASVNASTQLLQLDLVWKF